MAESKKSALFVCLANICRSPIAEAVFTHFVNEGGLADKWIIDSAATADYHKGENPDRRARGCMEKHGIPMNHKARLVTADDFRKFNYIFGMDKENISDLENLAPKNSTAKIQLLGDFDPEGPCIIRNPCYDVDDQGFEEIYRQCLRCCKAFLEKES